MGNNFLSMGNTYGSYSKRYGGGFPAWRSVAPGETSGGMLASLPEVGTLIPSGTLVSLDKVGGTATIVKSWYAAASATNTATSIKVKLASIYTLKPVVGDFIMIAPSTVDATGQGAEITAVALDGADTSGLTYTLTLAATLGTALTTSSILVQADGATASAKLLAIPSGITKTDIEISLGMTAASADSIFDGVIYEDRIQPVPASIKAVLPQIKFEKGI